MRQQPHKAGKKNGLAILLSVFLLLALAGCGGGGGMSDRIKQDAKALEKEMKTAQNFIQSKKDKFYDLAESADFKPMSDYATKENWKGDFNKANDALARAREIHDQTLAPIMKKNVPQEEVKAREEMNRIKRVIQEARNLAQAPFDRMERIRTAMTSTQSVYVAAGEAGSKIIEKIQPLEQGPVAAAREKFPASLTKINERFAPFSKMQSDTRARLDNLEKEYQAFNAAAPVNYAAFVDSADGINNDLKRLDTLIPKMEKDLENLYQSYTKVLQDMKIDYYVTIKREAWDENADRYTPRFATFRREVTPATYQELTESNLESIANIVPSYSRISLKNHIGPAWDQLDINPTENWPGRSYNAASFWVENTDAKYFHKYTQEANGETTETDWVKVNPSFFDQNQNNLGMAILSKPYGEFEPDTQAAPPGMAYVGNPEYGEWQKDQNGESFWSWYGRYAFFSNLFFFPPYHYHYGGWNRWHTGYRHKKPYYGKKTSGKYPFGTWGTKIKQTPRYQNTTFGRTGGFKSGPASVRGASLRGGGPKGKGK